MSHNRHDYSSVFSPIRSELPFMHISTIFKVWVYHPCYREIWKNDIISRNLVSPRFRQSFTPWSVFCTNMCFFNFHLLCLDNNLCKSFLFFNFGFLLLLHQNYTGKLHNSKNRIISFFDSHLCLKYEFAQNVFVHFQCTFYWQSLMSICFSLQTWR